MKNNKIYIILLIVLGGLAVYLYLKNEKSTLDPRLSEFSLEEKDVTSLDSIVLMRDSARLKLHKSNNRWYLNKQMYAREKSVRQFINVLQDLQVEAPAQRSNSQELLELIRSNAIRVRLYGGEKLIRDYLVEDNPYKKEITYMMMTESNEPFIMGLPGYKGDLAGFFRLDPAYWRNKTLFDYSGLDIRSIKVRYPSHMQKSFYLAYTDDSFRLQRLADKTYIKNFSSSKAARYFSYFSNVRFDEVLQDKTALLDSLDQLKPYCSFEIVDKQGRTTEFYTYRKKSEGKKDAFGQKSDYDLNYLYGFYHGAEEILLIKYTEFDPLFKEINYFRENN